MYKFQKILILLLICAIAACSGASTKPQTISPVETRGQAVFKMNCSTCHATSGDSVIVGPSMDGIAMRAANRVPGMDAQTYIRSKILDPDIYHVEDYVNNLMPRNFKDLISEEDFEALVAYLLTLE